MGLSCLIQLNYLSLHEDHANFQLLNSGTGFVQKYLLATHHTFLAYLDSVEIAKFPIPHVAAISLLLPAFAGFATCFSWAPHYGSPGIDWRVKGTASAVESCSFSWSNRQEDALWVIFLGALWTPVILSWVEHWSMRKWWIDLWGQKA